jgi:hypothetical protein
MATGRLVFLFAQPYADPEADAAAKRGPGLRARLLGLGAATLVLGGLLIAASALGLTSDAMPALIKLALYFILVISCGFGVSLIAIVLAMQNKMVDDQALKEGRGERRSGRVWRSNLLEIALLLGFGVGVLWFNGPTLPNLSDAAGLPPDALKERVGLFHFVSAWAFLAGALTFALQLTRAIDGKAAAILAVVFVPISDGVFQWAFDHATPTDRKVSLFSVYYDDPAAFRAELIQAEVLSLVGLALCLVLIAAPLFDLIRQSLAPGLENRFARMLCFVGTFSACIVVFELVAPSPILPFLVAAGVGMSLAIATPFFIAAMKGPRFTASMWLPPTTIGLGLGLAIVVLAVTPSFELAAGLLGAAAVPAAGTVMRKPKAPEPAWAEVF